MIVGTTNWCCSTCMLSNRPPSPNSRSSGRRKSVSIAALTAAAVQSDSTGSHATPQLCRAEPPAVVALSMPLASAAATMASHSASLSMPATWKHAGRDDKRTTSKAMGVPSTEHSREALKNCVLTSRLLKCAGGPNAPRGTVLTVVLSAAALETSAAVAAHARRISRESRVGTGGRPSPSSGNGLPCPVRRSVA